MKVIVGKMPGGRATEVEIPEGGTVLEAIKAAGYEADLNQGFEARVNNSQTELSSAVSENAIITLTSKITGNGISAISVVPVGTEASSEKFVVLTPTIIHDFINIPDVKSMLIRLKKTVLNSSIKCIIADSENLKVSKPVEVVVFSETVICADTTYSIDAGNYVVFCNENIANKIYGMDPLSAITYIEEYIPEDSRNQNSLASSKVPDGAEEIEVIEEDCLEEASEAKRYECYRGPKSENPHCNPSECCAECEEDECGNCSCGENEGCCSCECDVENLPEHYITLSEFVNMCERLKIDVSISIRGDKVK